MLIGLSSLSCLSAFQDTDRGDRMGAARDLLYQALELLSAHSTPEQINRAVGFLRFALDQYAAFADAHYYRYLCLKQLKKDPRVQASSLEAAKLYKSVALRENRDPFILAVPRIYDNLATVGDKWALIVGISHFQPNKGAKRLQYAAKDATALAAQLTDPEIGRFPSDHVFCLTNNEATTSGIKAKLNHIATEAKTEDIVLFYISTHGTSREDDIAQVSYLYTYDTSTTTKDEIFGSALPMVEISAAISNRCTAQRTVLIFDTCHSAASADSQSISNSDAVRLADGAGRYILSSCEAGQSSYEDDNREHGYFTASIMDHLRSRKGCIRLQDLFNQVQNDVSQQVSKLGYAQRPVLYKSASAAEIILGAAVNGANEKCLSSA